MDEQAIQISVDSLSSIRHKPANPAIPKPFMNGYLELANSDPRILATDVTWVTLYVEVSDGVMKLRQWRDDLSSEEVVIDLGKYFVSIQSKKQIRMEDSWHVHSRTFRAVTEARALQWMVMLTQFCLTIPSAEGYTKKLGGKNKNSLQLRYLRLSEEGLLSWYKGETAAEPQGTIQIRGESVEQENKDPGVIVIDTTAKDQVEKRRYCLNFKNAIEAARWFNALTWQARRDPQLYTSIPIRNARN